MPSSKMRYQNGTKKIMKNIPDEVNHETIMILGHNPGSEMLINNLTGDFIRMPTASAALLIESNGSWEVEGVIRPKEI